KTFVKDYIRKLVAHRVTSALGTSDPALGNELTQKYTSHFHEVFETIDHEVKELFTEAVAESEQQNTFVFAKLKLRCFEIFQRFDEPSQSQLMDTIDELIRADGQQHPAETKFRAELADLLNEELGVQLLEDFKPPPVKIASKAALVAPAEDHPFFGQFEYHYSKEQSALREQVRADRALIDKVIDSLSAQRRQGQGRLAGKYKVDEFADGESFLDGHVYVVRPQLDEPIEVTVVGDLHGCYS